MTKNTDSVALFIKSVACVAIIDRITVNLSLYLTKILTTGAHKTIHMYIPNCTRDESVNDILYLAVEPTFMIYPDGRTFVTECHNKRVQIQKIDT